MVDWHPSPSRTARLPVLFLAAVVLAVLAAALGIVILARPMPPRALAMATGPEGSAYADFGARYREILARSGVDLRLVATAGAIENLGRLRDATSRVDVGFVQAGTSAQDDGSQLVSLGTVFYEPLWIFCRGLPRGEGLEWLAGKRLSIGPEGSGTRALALRLLALTGMEPQALELLPLTPEEADAALGRGEIEAAALLTSWDSHIVRTLLATKDVALASFPRADAYVAHDPYLNKLVLPMGVADLARNIPPTDTVLLAPKSSLVVRRDLHPALQYLLLEAAAEIHGGPGIFHLAGQFPAPEAIDLPLADNARHFYKAGLPWLQRHLPFWVAGFAERLLVLLIPAVGLLYPLARFLPALYAWGVQRHIFRLYGELKFLEAELSGGDTSPDRVGLLTRLDALEARANRIRVPGSFTAPLYMLKQHIAFVRHRLDPATRPPVVAAAAASPKA
jgi:TRAP-type uncharacterized transport system substrate-binding protein